MPVCQSWRLPRPLRKRPRRGRACRATGLVGRPAAMGGVRTARVVERQISPEAGARLAGAVVGPQVDILVLDAFPHPRDEDAVAPAAAAIHADLDALGPQPLGEGLADKLAAPGRC